MRDPDLEKLKRFAMANGWEITRTAKNHLRFSRRGSPPVFASGTPGDFRAHRNALKDLKRCTAYT